MAVRLFTLFSLLLSFSLHSAAVPDTLYSGVYELEGQDGFYIVLKKSGKGYVGFTGTSEQAVGIRGDVNGPLLEARFLEGEDSTVNYIVINERNNLQLSDGLFTFFIFRRTPMDADSLYALFSVNKNKSNDPVTNSATTPSRFYAGKKFLHLKTGNGYSEKWAYYLYQDGSFRFKGDNSYVNSNASENFSGATANEDAGTWEVVAEENGEFLVLKWTNGQLKRLLIRKTADGYDLNGTRYFLVGLSDYE